MAEDRATMRSSERLVVLGGLGMAIASVVPWYTADELVFDSTRTNGWQEPDAILSILGTLAGVLLAVVVLVGSRQPERPRLDNLSWGALLTVGGCISLGLVALKFSLNMDRTTVADLAARLAGNPNLARASTYASRSEANHWVDQAILANRDDIDAWLANPNAGNRLPFHVDFGDNASIGRVLERGAASSTPGRGVQVVLERRPPGSDPPYLIVTSYPTPGL